MPITDWPQAERPREKLLERGPRALSDAELLAIFLRVGTRGRTAVDLARELLARFGGLRGLLAADRRDFCSGHGLGTAKYAQLQAALEMGRRYLAEPLQRGEPLTAPEMVGDFLVATLRDRASEVFCCLFLDARHRLIAFEELFHGTIHGAAVHPREVVRRALGHNAAAVIFVHNHPSGVAEPSRADEELTFRLRDTLAVLDIRLLDHLVVGDGELISMSARGVI